MAKSKSMKGKDGQRKLASGHGRGKAKSGGEHQKGSDRRRVKPERQTIIDLRRPKFVK
jgi:hypothetical protein